MPRKLPIPKLIEMNDDLAGRSREYLNSWERAVRQRGPAARTNEVVEMSWQSIASAPEGVVVDTKIDNADGIRNEQPLKRYGNLWFFPDGSMYVHYTPTHWRPVLGKGE